MAVDSRRGFLKASLHGCAWCGLASSALARVLPSTMTALVGVGYAPKDVDERGLWQDCDRLEKEIAGSNLLIADMALKDYVAGILQRLLGPLAASVRLYLLWDREFNAFMMPNGAMVVQSGLLARMRNEAQLAAVLGHESGHYLRRHTVQNFRGIKTRSAVMAAVGIAGGAAGAGWYGVANAINTGLLLSLFSYSREMESEADAFGLKLLAAAGYTPGAAAQIWRQLIEERKASAAARKKRYHDRATSAISTHPPTEERMSDLTLSAGEIERAAGKDASYHDGQREWITATAAIRPGLLEEQIKLNDPGASLYLIDSLSQDGWDSILRYFQGETYRLRDESGDAARAAQAYAAAVQFPEVFPEAWRAQGYTLLKSGHPGEGRQALERYLQLRPDAPDAGMVRFSLSQ